jgi:hypothetical protein
MASIPDSGWVEQVRKIIEDLVGIPAGRRKRGALKNASSLIFWGDGMLGPLRRIAEGQGSDQDLAHLEAGYETSRGEVDEAIWRLTELRERLNNTALENEMARLIDDIINGQVGKRRIREKIQALVEGSDHLNREDALKICADIEEFNAKIGQLYKATSKPPLS